MTAREFVRIVKKHAVDGTAKSVVDGQRRLAARPLSTELPPQDPKFLGQNSLDRAIGEARETVKWLEHLSEEDRTKIQSLLQECSEATVFHFLNVLDGTGGDFEGVFEVYAVTEESSVLLNLQNTDMLHDVFSEVCEEQRDEL
jgi:hypothetical protein